MACSVKDSVVPILLIENEQEHADQVRDMLEGTGSFSCEHLTAADDERIYGYIASHPEAQIMIVDLSLNATMDADPLIEGQRLIRDKLWPYNQTLFFVIFSAYVHHKTTIEFNRFDPHWVFVQKELSDGKFTDECLSNLRRVVEDCRDRSPPIVPTPRLESLNLVLELSEFGANRNRTEDYGAPIERLNRSVEILNALSDEAAQYVKSGHASLQIGMGVFGSCGRLEMRKDSDIEFCVYFEGKETEAAKNLAVMFWNRMKSFMEHQQWKYEGSDLIADNSPKILLMKDASDAFELKNRYMPSISIDTLVNIKISRESEIRHRHLQILTELRPIFNPLCVFLLKRSLIEKNIEDQVGTLSNLLSSAYFSSLITQALLDQGPSNRDNPHKKAKSVYYRVFGIQALQLGLIARYMEGNHEKLDSDEAWRSLFEFLTLPGISKILNLVSVLRKMESANEVTELAKDYADHYCTALNGLDVGVGIGPKALMKGTSSRFISLAERLGRESRCNVLFTMSPWLFQGQKHAEAIHDA